MSKDRVLLGVVAAPHGTRGVVRIKSFTEDPMSLAAYGPLSDESGTKEYRVEPLSAARGAVLARIEGVADRTAAEDCAGCGFTWSASVAGDGRAGMVRGRSGRPRGGRQGRPGLGQGVAFHDFGAGSVPEVSGGTMLPFTDAAVPEVDVQGGKVVVDPPAGLLTGGGEEKEVES